MTTRSSVAYTFGHVKRDACKLDEGQKGCRSPDMLCRAAFSSSHEVRSMRIRSYTMCRWHRHNFAPAVCPFSGSSSQVCDENKLHSGTDSRFHGRVGAPILP